VLLLCVFFFSSRRRHTRFSRDWSSDVCSSDLRGEEDFAGFRRFQAGDSPRHVAWKAYARSGELYSKQFAGADTSSQWLDYDEIRSEERRVGKEWRYEWSRHQRKKQMHETTHRT